MVVTHYQRLLNYIVPDFVHVLIDGRIVRSGGKELALELEEKGYGWLEGAASGAPPVSASTAAQRSTGFAPASGALGTPGARRGWRRIAPTAPRARSRPPASRRRGTRSGGTPTSAPIAGTAFELAVARGRRRRGVGAAHELRGQRRHRRRRQRLLREQLSVVGAARWASTSSGLAGGQLRATRTRRAPAAVAGLDSTGSRSRRSTPPSSRTASIVVSPTARCSTAPIHLVVATLPERGAGDGRIRASSIVAGAQSQASVDRDLRRPRRRRLPHQRRHRGAARRGRRARPRHRPARAPAAFHVAPRARAPAPRPASLHVARRVARRPDRAQRPGRRARRRGRRRHPQRPLRGRRPPARRQPHAHRPRDSRTAPATSSTRASSTARRAASSTAGSSCGRTRRRPTPSRPTTTCCCRTRRRSTPTRSSRSSPTTSSAPTAPPSASSTRTRSSTCSARHRRRGRRATCCSTPSPARCSATIDRRRAARRGSRRRSSPGSTRDLADATATVAPA